MHKENYNRWLSEPKLNKDLELELLSISGNDEEIEDRFYRKLEFGTAGIRGVLGIGTNRMNVHTVGEVTEGLARKIMTERRATDGVVIGYDVRHMSKEFAEMTAEILSSHGITVHLFPDIIPTPVLSYAVRKLKAVAGIMITASHNPKEYNGYKVYWDDGAQVQEHIVKDIVSHMTTIENIFDIERLELNKGLKAGLVNYVGQDLINVYKKKVLDLSVSDDINKEISVVYSPLNGTGRTIIRKVLKERGFKNVTEVKEQEYPDPNFTSVEYPNPEEEKSFRLSIERGLEVSADVLITTDPDADRLGVMVHHNEKYEFLSGNKLGTVLTYYMLSSLNDKGLLNRNSSIVKTIVTDNLVDKIAKDFKVNVHDVHVGFKNVYALVKEWEHAGTNDYVLGYEESLGFGVGHELARDKDAVSAAMLVVEMVAYYNRRGETLVDVLNEIQDRYGYHSEELKSVTMPGKHGQYEMESLVKDFRSSPIQSMNGSPLTEVIDYLEDETGLEKMNVLKYLYEDGTWFVIRPSGTEPKLKLYIYTIGETKEESEHKLMNTVNTIMNRLGRN